MAAACGTYSGWARHKAQGETPCEPCVEAQRAYHRQYRASGRKQEWRRANTCASCGVPFRTTTKATRFCSQLCYRFDRFGPLACDVPATHVSRDARDLSEIWRAQRKPLRAAYEDGDAGLFFAALVHESDTSGDCWVWPRLREGYPILRLARRREVPLHRIVLEMKHGAPLGSQHAHHVCANTACVNPEHLQPVTHRENVAEMLARQSYLARIRELESALADLAPDHPLLGVITVA